MEIDVKSCIADALKKYGVKENLCLEEDLIKNWEKFISIDTIKKTSITSDLSLRHKLINKGRILEENTEAHYYYWIISLNGIMTPEALVVTILDGTDLYLGAFAKEGILSRGTASKVLRQIKQAVTK